MKRDSLRRKYCFQVHIYQYKAPARKSQEINGQHIYFPLMYLRFLGYTSVYMFFFEKTGCVLLAAFFLTTAVSGESPDPILGLTPAATAQAGRAEYIPGYSPNIFGVYPVRIRWQKPAAVDGASLGYHVYRSTKPNAEFEQITAAPVSVAAESGGFFTFIDENPSAVPGKPYYYRVLSLDARGESHYSEAGRPAPEAGGLEVSPCMGYGALSHEQYMLEYNKTVKASHRKMTYMNKPAALSKLGAETQSGTVGGSLSYRARIAGLGARVTLHYERYADFYIDNDRSLGPYFTLTGDTNISASMSQSGRMDGTVNAAGMYPGKIFYDKIEIKSGVAAGGTYGIEPEGFPRAEIDWPWGNR